MRKRKLIIGVSMLLFHLCFIGIAGAVPHNLEDACVSGKIAEPFEGAVTVGDVRCDSCVNDVVKNALTPPGAFLGVRQDKDNFAPVVEPKFKPDVDPIDFDCVDRVKEKNEFRHHKDKDDCGDENPTAPVPEPAVMLLLGAGLAGIAVFKRLKDD